MPKVVRLNQLNCTVPGGPLKCRYHSRLLKKHPSAKQFKSLENVFYEVDKQFAPSQVLESQWKTSSDRADAAFAHGEMADQLESTYSSEERHALYSYSDEHGSLPFRLVLSNPEGSYSWNHLTKETVLNRVNRIDQVIEQYGVDVSQEPLWRGVKELHDLKGLKRGDTIQYPSYVSTSKDREVALSFSTRDYPILVQMESKVGLPVHGYYGLAEQEILLPRGLTFKVVDIAENVQVNTTNSSHPEVRNVTVIKLAEV